MARWLLVVAFVGSLVFFMVNEQPTSRVNANSAEFCKTKPSEVEGVLTYWTKLGVIKKLDPGSLWVDDRPWEQTSFEAKVSMALSAFCRTTMKADGSGMLIVRGYLDGRIRGSVTDGHYFRG